MTKFRTNKKGKAYPISGKNIDKSQYKKPRKTTEEKILSAYDKGDDVGTIGKKVGASPSYVWEVVRKRHETDQLESDDESGTISLKEFKKKIKDSGYSYKTHVSGGGSIGNPHRHLEIVDKDKNFIVGSGGNVYTKEDMEKHPKAFALIRKYKDRVYDEEGDKVLF